VDVDAATAVAAAEVADMAVAALPVSGAALELAGALQVSVDGAAMVSMYIAGARFLDAASAAAAAAVAAEAVGAAGLAGYGHPAGAR